MKIQGVEDLGAIAPPERSAMQVDKAHPSDAVENALERPLATEALNDLLRERPVEYQDVQLVHSQARSLHDLCQRGRPIVPSRRGDYVPVVEGLREGVEGASLLPTFGHDYVSGDAIVQDVSGDETELVRIVPDEKRLGGGGTAIVCGLGPRSTEIRDGSVALISGRSVKAVDVIPISKIVGAFESRTAIDTAEQRMWRDYGIRIQDLSSKEIDIIAEKIRTAPASEESREPAVFTAKQIQSSENRSDNDFGILARRRLAELASSTTHAQDVSESTDTLEASFRRAGSSATRSAISRGLQATTIQRREVRTQPDIASGFDFAGNKNASVSQTNEVMEIIASARRVIDIDSCATAEIESEDLARAPANGDVRITPSSKLALLGCTDVFECTGFALTDDTLRRTSEAALRDFVADSKAIEARVSSYRIGLESQGRSAVEADIIARDVCARQAMKQSPQELLVKCGYHLMVAFIAQSIHDGRLCVQRLHRSFAKDFGLVKPLESNGPSVVSYVSKIIRSVHKFDAEPVKWNRKAEEIAEHLELMAKTRKLGRTLSLLKFSGLKRSILDPNILPTSSSTSATSATRSDADFPAPIQRGNPEVPPNLRCDVPQTNLVIPNLRFLENALTETSSGPVADAHEPFRKVPYDSLPRQARRILRDGGRTARLVHITGPVITVLMYCDPLPRWAAGLIQNDKELARLVQSVRKTTLESTRVQSPLSLLHAAKSQSLSREDVVASYFIDKVFNQSPAILDLCNALDERLCAQAEDGGDRRAKSKSFSRDNQTNGTDGAQSDSREDHLLWGDGESEFDMFRDSEDAEISAFRIED